MRPLLLGLLAIAALSTAAGCARNRRPGYSTPAVIDARQVERLRRVAERDIGCPDTAMVLVPLADAAVEVRGCERIREYSLVCRRRRCAWQPMVPAAVLAARDLACPLEAMSVAAPSPSLRDLVGCGRMGRYHLSCDGETACHWSLMGPPGPDAATAPPPTYGSTYAPPPVATATVVVQPSPGQPPPQATVAPQATPATVVPAASGDEIPPPPQGSTLPPATQPR